MHVPFQTDAYLMKQECNRFYIPVSSSASYSKKYWSAQKGNTHIFLL